MVYTSFACYNDMYITESNGGLKVESYFNISYLKLDRNGDWEKVETDAYSIILHTNRHDKLHLIQLVRDGYNDWVNLDEICDFRAELKI